VQVVHGMAVTGCEYGVYVVAATYEIIRVVVVRLGFQVLGSYLATLHYIWEKADVGWITTGKLPNVFTPEQFEKGCLKHAVDAYTVEQTLDLYHCMKKKIRDRGIPLPDGRMLIPSLVALWNKCKGPIDVYSRFLCDSQGKHKKQSANARVWIRSIMTCAYNAYTSYILYKTMTFLYSDKCQSYNDFQRKRREVACFDWFLSELSDTLTIPSPVSDDALQNEDCSDDEQLDRTDEEYSPPAPHVKHNRRRLFIGNGEYVQFRLNTEHKPKKIQKGQRTCVVCCGNNHSDPSHEKFCKKRLGLRPKYYCPKCNVTLCTVPRYDGRSCFWWFHNVADLPDCCTPEADINISVTRRKANHSIGTEEDSNEHCDDQEGREMHIDSDTATNVITEIITKSSVVSRHQKGKQDPESNNKSYDSDIATNIVTEIVTKSKIMSLQQKGKRVSRKRSGKAKRDEDFAVDESGENSRQR
jgi:hypothetical protein